MVNHIGVFTAGLGEGVQPAYKSYGSNLTEKQPENVVFLCTQKTKQDLVSKSNVSAITSTTNYTLGESLIITMLFSFNKVKSFLYKMREEKILGFSQVFSSPQILILNDSKYLGSSPRHSEFLLNLSHIYSVNN